MKYATWAKGGESNITATIQLEHVKKFINKHHPNHTSIQLIEIKTSPQLDTGADISLFISKIWRKLMSGFITNFMACTTMGYTQKYSTPGHYVAVNQWPKFSSSLKHYPGGWKRSVCAKKSVKITTKLRPPCSPYQAASNLNKFMDDYSKTTGYGWLFEDHWANKPQTWYTAPSVCTTGRTH